MGMPEILCIVGPTASGKTNYAVQTAAERNGEVVSCDSMQIYKYMDIGTAKPTASEMQGIRHHMIDFVDPRENYSVADFVKDANNCISDILNRGKLPILCGGTGLYIDSIINGIEFASDGIDKAYRAELEAFARENGAEALHAMLAKKDVSAAQKIHPNNIKRVIRALEIIKSTGMTKTEADAAALKEPLYNAEMIGLYTEREELYKRINARVDKMLDMGLLDEVRRLIDMEIPRDSTAMQAIGYKELVEYIDGRVLYTEAVEKIKRESRRYAKRQMTWFKRNEKIKWVQV